MPIMFSNFMKNHVKILSSVLKFVLFFLATNCAALDAPIERDFIPLPNDRWIWLEKVDVHASRIILGSGPRAFSNRIWFRKYEEEYERVWDYTFFVRILPGQFVVADKLGRPLVAIVPYDISNNPHRMAIIYRVLDLNLVEVSRIEPFNVAADESIFMDASQSLLLGSDTNKFDDVQAVSAFE